MTTLSQLIQHVESSLLRIEEIANDYLSSPETDKAEALAVAIRHYFEVSRLPIHPKHRLLAVEETVTLDRLRSEREADSGA